MRNDPLKIVKRIIRQPVKECQPKRVYLIRQVITASGIMATVKSRGHPAEPSGTYSVWLPYPEMYTSEIIHALKDNRLVRAHIELIDDCWEVLGFDIDSEPLVVHTGQGELARQREEYEAYANY